MGALQPGKFTPSREVHLYAEQIYSIQDSQLTVWVVKVGHRREV